MRVHELQTYIPVVERTTTALDAARHIADEGLSALVVADENGRPAAVISAVDILGLLVPDYLLDDLSLAGVVDEKGAEELWSGGARRILGELLDDVGTRVKDILVVDANATIVELAARMADARAQIAFVHGSSVDKPAFVQLPTVMEAILRFASREDGGDL